MTDSHSNTICTSLSSRLPIFSGDAVNLHSHQSSRVLPAGGGDHPANIAGGAAARQIPHIRHDTRLNKVMTSLASENSEEFHLFTKAVLIFNSVASPLMGCWQSYNRRPIGNPAEPKYPRFFLWRVFTVYMELMPDVAACKERSW